MRNADAYQIIREARRLLSHERLVIASEKHDAFVKGAEWMLSEVESMFENELSGNSGRLEKKTAPPLW